MNTKKAIIKEYKARKLHGGVYQIRNTINGKYVIDSALNLQSARNSFAFSIKNGSIIYHAMRQDWREHGPQAFSFSVLEELLQGDEQTEAEFREELKILEQLYRDQYDPEQAY